MGKILDYIADETQGKRFASFKYCYDDTLGPIEYDPDEEHYINMKEYAESVHDPKMRDMSARAEYGKQIVAQVATQLQNYYGKKGFESRNIRRMMQFAKEFPDFQIVSPLVSKLSWTHFLTVMALKDELQREF